MIDAVMEREAGANRDRYRDSCTSRRVFTVGGWPRNQSECRECWESTIRRSRVELDSARPALGMPGLPDVLDMIKMNLWCHLGFVWKCVLMKKGNNYSSSNNDKDRQQATTTNTLHLKLDSSLFLSMKFSEVARRSLYLPEILKA